MSYTFDQAVAELANRSTLADLIDLVRNTGAQVEGAPVNATSVLYSGTINGESAINVAETLTASTTGETGANRFVRVDDTSVGKLLVKDAFIAKVNSAINADLVATVPGFNDLSVAERNGLKNEATFKIFANKDALGNRLPIDPAHPSLWDVASKNFTEQATGAFRVIAADVSETSVLMQTELPALLARTNNPLVDGIELNHIKSVAEIDAAMSEILVQARAQTYLSHLSSGNLNTYKGFQPEDVGKALSLADNLGAFNTLIDEMSPAQRARFVAGVKAMGDANTALASSGLMRGVSKLGIVAATLSFVLAGQAAAAEHENGNDNAAKNIMMGWGVEFGGSLIGGSIGTLVGGIAVGAAAAAGVAIAVPLAAALVFGATLVGGYFGAEGATDLYQLLKDRDENGRRDLFDKLSNLLFGVTSTITTPLPQDLNGNKLTIDASLSRDDIVANANDSIAWRYALRELNPFVVTDIDYARHNLDGSLNLLDETTGVGMSSLYMADRAAMLAWKIKWDQQQARDDDDSPRMGHKSYDDDWDTAAIAGNWDFVDMSVRLPGGAPLTLAIDGAGLSLSDHQIVFGSANADVINGEGDSDHLYGMAGNDTLTGKAGADYLEGGSGNDSLSGGDGADTLLGGAGGDWLEGGLGNDQLKGGAGIDTYRFSGAWGHDTIEDSDGQGAIEVDGLGQLNGSGAKKVAEGVWQTDDKRVNYTLVSTGGSSNDLYISFSDRPDVITIRNWSSDKNLGIALSGDIVAPTTTNNLVGDVVATNGDYTIRTGLDGSYVANFADGPQDLMGGSAGSDSLSGLGGNDGIAGFAGDDLLEGGEGRDMMLGGAGADTLNGGEGDDFIFGSGQSFSLIDPLDARYPVVATVAGTEVARGPGWLVTLTPNNSYQIDGAFPDPVSDDKGNIIDGGAGRDYVHAGTGSDVVHGGAGNDEVWGLAGNDTVFGDSGDDILLADGPNGNVGIASVPADQQGDDILDGGIGNDRLIGFGGDDELYGGADNDSLWGDGGGNLSWTPAAYHGADYLDGGDGADLLVGEGADDELFGGIGDDVLWGDARDSTLPIEANGDDYLDGEDGADQLSGGGKDDQLFGGAGNDSLWGDADTALLAGSAHGDDYLDGEDGDDFLAGYGGKDTLYGGAGADVLFGDADASLDGSFHGGDYLDGEEGDDGLIGGGGDDTLYGSAGNDSLLGDDPALAENFHGADYLDGGAGSDELSGGAGNDTLVGGAGVDYLAGGAGDDTYLIQAGDSPIVGGLVDSIVDSQGANTLVLNGLTATASAVNGTTDVLLQFDSASGLMVGNGLGGSISEVVIDGVTLNFADWLQSAMTQDSTINGSASTSALMLLGGSGSDVVIGGNGDDTLRGGAGRDTLNGGWGNDSLIGGLGDDVLDGGVGDDTFRYQLGDGVDQIADYSGANAIELGAGIAPSATRVALTNFGPNFQKAITLVFDGNSSDKIILGFPSQNGYFVWPVQEVRFADGTIWTPEQIAAAYFGGTPGNDQVFGFHTSDLISGGAGHDDLEGRDGNDTLLGGQGDDLLSGDSGDDVLSGEAGDDRLFGGSGNDTFLFGRGDGIDRITNFGAQLDQDRILFAADISPSQVVATRRRDPDVWTPVSDWETENELLLSIAGTGDAIRVRDYFRDDARADWTVKLIQFADGTIWDVNTVKQLVMAGTAGDDHLYGYSSNDLLSGGAGNDVLDGARGVDTLIGGMGDDTYGVDSMQDVVLEGAGEGTDTVKAASGFVLPDNVENLTLIKGAKGVVAVGNALDNVMRDESNPIGRTPADINHLAGGLGNDTYFQGSGFVIDEAPNEGIDTYVGFGFTLSDNVENGIQTTGSYSNGNGLNNVLQGSAQADHFDGKAGNDSLYGAAGADELIGSEGDDLLDGGTGSDTMTGGIGNDTYVVDSVADVVIELAGEGVDAVQSGVAYTLGANVDNLTLMGSNAINGTGNALANVLSGNSGNNVLTGGDGDDSINAGAGNDTLDGGLGSDTLDGGLGNNNYLFGRGDGSDVVLSFDNATAGKLNTLQFKSGVATTDIVKRKVDDPVWGAGASLEISIAGTTDKIVIQGFFAGGSSANPNNPVQQFKFSSGTTWNLAQIESGLNNRAPTVASAIPDKSTAEDAVFSYVVPTGTFTDPDVGDTLSYSATQADGSALPSWLSFNAGTRTFSGTPLNANVGSATVRVTARDAAGLTVSDDFILNVTNTNDAPTVVTAVATQAATQGSAFSYVVPTGTFADVDVGDTLSYALTRADGSALPAWLSFNASTRTLSGTPANADVGSLSLRATARDAAGATVSSNFSLNVANVNDTPILASPIADQSASQGLAFSYVVPVGAFTDPDVGDTLIYSATQADGSALPSWLSFNASTRTFTGTPSATGTVSVQVVARDGGNLNASDTFNIAITVQNLALSGTSGADNLTGGVGNDTLNGLAGNDTLTGNAGDDRLDGGTGNDSLIGGAGNDTYIVDSATDVITEATGQGTDLVQSAVTYTLGANVENLTLTGTAANGTGNTLNNVLSGNSANNTLDGGAGADTLIGGAGNDTYTIDNTADVITEQTNEGTDLVQSSVAYTLSANVENLTLTGTNAISGTGNTLDNSLTGNSANNTLTGGAGNDVLSGGTGTDTMVGGTGNDTYVIDVTADVVTEAANEGIDLVQAGATYTLSSNVENLTLTGSGTINGTGNALDNVLTGNSANNTLTGAAGNDVLNGGTGNDTMVGGSGNDTYVVNVSTDVVTELANEGTDTVQSAVAWTLGSNLENLTLTGSGTVNGTGNTLDNLLTGNSANNTLTGAAGNDTLDGGLGNDTLVGGTGNDTYVVNASTDVTTENANEGTDTVQSAVTWTLGTNLENITLTGSGVINGTGNASANVLTGNSANNTLSGLGGADTLDGGAGNDTLNGGAAADIYQFARGYGQDTVQDNDSTAGVKDRVQFAAGIVQGDITYAHVGNNLEARINGSTDKIVVQDWYLGSQYHVEEFRFNDGSVLTDSQVQGLVSAMASFSAASSGQTSGTTVWRGTLPADLAASAIM